MASAEQGYATWYSSASARAEGRSGRWTASGDRFTESAMTCALPHRPAGARYRVCRGGSSRCVVVRHNDYGPGRAPQRRGVIVDLTPAAFRRLAPLGLGRIKVSVERLGAS